MKRDMDLVREILIQMEDWPNAGESRDVKLPGRTSEEISYHLGLMSGAGLIEAVDASSDDGPAWLPLGLSWEGHEFLDAARSDAVWSKAKDLALTTTGTLTVEALKAALSAVIRSLVTGTT